jgi:hypothetical protein
MIAHYQIASEAFASATTLDDGRYIEERTLSASLIID